MIQLPLLQNNNNNNNSLFNDGNPIRTCLIFIEALQTMGYRNRRFMFIAEMNRQTRCHKNMNLKCYQLNVKMFEMSKDNK